MTDISNVIEQVRMKYAPDKRVALFSVKTEEKDGKIVLTGESNLPQAVAELKKELAGQNMGFEIKSLPDTEGLKDKTYGVINLSVANIRSNPDHPAEMATQSLLGTRVNVLKEEDGWYLVQTPDGYISWTDDAAVQLMTKESADNWTSAKRVIYTAEYGFSYTSTDENSQRVSDLVKGDILKYIDESKGFVKVEYPDKREAYVPSRYCMELGKYLAGLKPSQESVVTTAKTLMGLPYLWGGTSMKGVDCSGFTKTIYYINGIILPRDASQQVNVGELVDTEQGFDKLQPGDLLFFGRKATATTKEKATHVGMYIGGGEYIHSAGRVKINSLVKEKENFSEYRYNTFLKARRILSSINTDGIYLIKDNKFYFEDAK